MRTDLQTKSTKASGLRREIRGLFKQSPRVLVLLRYAYAAGSRDFIFLKTLGEFEKLVAGLAPRTSVIVMKSVSLIFGGRIEAELVETALSGYQETSSWLIMATASTSLPADWAFAGSRVELRDEVEFRLGEEIAVVEEPDWHCDGKSIAAYVPDPDGIVRLGAY